MIPDLVSAVVASSEIQFSPLRGEDSSGLSKLRRRKNAVMWANPVLMLGAVFLDRTTSGMRNSPVIPGYVYFDLENPHLTRPICLSAIQFLQVAFFPVATNLRPRQFENRFHEFPTRPCPCSATKRPRRKNPTRGQFLNVSSRAQIRKTGRFRKLR